LLQCYSIVLHFLSFPRSHIDIQPMLLNLPAEDPQLQKKDKRHTQWRDGVDLKSLRENL